MGIDTHGVERERPLEYALWKSSPACIRRDRHSFPEGKSSPPQEERACLQGMCDECSLVKVHRPIVVLHHPGPLGLWASHADDLQRVKTPFAEMTSFLYAIALYRTEHQGQFSVPITA